MDLNHPSCKIGILQWMFYNAEKFNIDIGGWNLSAVTNMWEVFAETDAFNQDINSWDTSNVVYMEGMFYDATGFIQDISNWDLSNVEEMNIMFTGASSFNQNLCAWRDTFPYGSSHDDIFDGSGCTFSGRPRRLNEGQGPLCASGCATPTVSLSSVFIYLFNIGCVYVNLIFPLQAVSYTEVFEPADVDAPPASAPANVPPADAPGNAPPVDAPADSPPADAPADAPPVAAPAAAQVSSGLVASTSAFRCLIGVVVVLAFLCKLKVSESG